MDHCKQCGAELPAEASFCTQCGARVEADKPQETPLEPANDLTEPVPPADPVPESGVEAQAGAAPPAPEPAEPVPAPAPVPPVPAPPPPYGYGAPPPQVPPAYGYGQVVQPPPPGGPPPAYAYPPGPPAYAPAPAPPKRKKRWWILLIILAVVAGLIATSLIVFGDQIKNLFQSTEKRWEQADKASRLIPEDSLLYTLREAVDKGLDREKYGYVTELSLDVKADSLPEEVAELLAVLSSLRIQLENRFDTSGEEVKFQSRIALGQRGDPEGTPSPWRGLTRRITLSSSVPKLMGSALAVSKDEMEGLLDGDEGLGSLFASSGNAPDRLGILTGETQ